MPGKEQFMTELKMKEMQLINWFGCPNLIYTRDADDGAPPGRRGAVHRLPSGV
mgnify:CR=1 FL=1